MRCDVCDAEVAVSSDTPDTDLRRLGWHYDDGKDLCPLCRPDSLRERIADALGITVTGRYVDDQIVEAVKALKTEPATAMAASAAHGYNANREMVGRRDATVIESIQDQFVASHLSEMLSSVPEGDHVGFVWRTDGHGFRRLCLVVWESP